MDTTFFLSYWLNAALSLRYYLDCDRRPSAIGSALVSCILAQVSGKKKQHKHKLFGPDFQRTFLTLTPGCAGVKKFLPTTGAAGKRTFSCGRPRFSARTSMTRRVFEKLCTKKVCVDFSAPKVGALDRLILNCLGGSTAR